MFSRHAMLVSAVLALSACGSTPVEPDAAEASGTPDQSGQGFNYKYKAPPEVSAADAEACGQRASSEATREASTVSDRGAVVFGAIGAIVQLTRVRLKLNATYEKVMKACLREKGYEIAD